MAEGGLKGAWTGNCDLLVFSAERQDHMSALAQAYHRLYLPHFSPSDGFDSIEKWLRAFCRPDSPVDYRISVAGNHLRGRGTPQVKGICVSAYFKDSDTGYLGYIVVDPHSRTEGLGYALFRQHESSMIAAARDNGGELRGLYLDCHDPAKPAHDGYDPQKRLDKYFKWGGKRIVQDYRVPVVTRPGAVVDDLALIAFRHPVTGAYPDPSATCGFLWSLYRDNGVANPAEHPYFVRMTGNMRAIDRKDEKAIEAGFAGGVVCSPYRTPKNNM